MVFAFLVNKLFTRLFTESLKTLRVFDSQQEGNNSWILYTNLSCIFSGERNVNNDGHHCDVKRLR